MTESLTIARRLPHVVHHVDDSMEGMTPPTPHLYLHNRCNREETHRMLLCGMQVMWPRLRLCQIVRRIVYRLSAQHPQCVSARHRTALRNDAFRAPFTCQQHITIAKSNVLTVTLRTLDVLARR